MTPSELKYHVHANGNPHFFTRSTMRFFGDRMANYGVRTVTLFTIGDDRDTPVFVEAWELYRKHPVKHGIQDSAYFAKDTFKRLFPHRYEEVQA